MAHRTPPTTALPAAPAAARRRPSLGASGLGSAAARALCAAGLLGFVLAAAGCQPYEPAPFDPRQVELNERRGANDAATQLDAYPTTLQAIPTPQGGGTAGGPRRPNDAYIATLPTTGRSYSDRDAVPLSLREVITRAVLYNGDVKVAGYEPAINAQRVIEQIGVFDPAIFTTVQTERTDTGLGTASIGGNQVVGFTDKTVTNSLSTGLRQRLPTGGLAELSYDLSWSRIDNLDTPGTNDSVNQRFWQNQLRLEVTQPLLRDFGRDINNARIEIARGDQRISVLDFRRALEEQLSELERAYWQLFQANRVVQIQENLLAETIETYRVLYERFIKGLDASEIPVSQAQSSVKARQADLIRAKQNVRDLSDEIKRRMNDPQFPVSSAYVIVPADEPLKEPVRFDYQTAIDAAAYNRFELAQQLVRIDQARIAEVVAYDNRLPRLDVVGTGGFRGLGQTVGEASSRNFDFNTPSFSLGLQFEYPIGNRVARSIVQRARLQRMQAIEQYRNLLSQVSLDVRIAMNDIQSSWEQAIARTQSRLASRRQLDLIQKQQDLGEPITPSFVQIKLQAQEELANAAREESAAIANYNVAIQRLERSKGTLLKYNNVKVAEDPTQAYLKRSWAAYETDPARGVR